MANIEELEKEAERLSLELRKVNESLRDQGYWKNDEQGVRVCCEFSTGIPGEPVVRITTSPERVLGLTGNCVRRLVFLVERERAARNLEKNG